MSSPLHLKLKVQRGHREAKGVLLIHGKAWATITHAHEMEGIWVNRSVQHPRTWAWSYLPESQPPAFLGRKTATTRNEQSNPAIAGHANARRSTPRIAVAAPAFGPWAPLCGVLHNF